MFCLLYELRILLCDKEELERGAVGRRGEGAPIRVIADVEREQ